MGIVVLEREVAEAKIKDRLHCRIQSHRGQRTRLARQLEAGLLEVIRIQMSVAECVNELAGPKIAGLRHHHRQKCVRRDVEWEAEENVGAALVHLAGQRSVRDVEL